MTSISSSSLVCDELTNLCIFTRIDTDAFAIVNKYDWVTPPATRSPLFEPPPPIFQNGESTTTTNRHHSSSSFIMNPPYPTEEETEVEVPRVGGDGVRRRQQEAPVTVSIGEKEQEENTNNNNGNGREGGNGAINRNFTDDGTTTTTTSNDTDASNNSTSSTDASIAPWTDPVNQDQLSDRVSITRDYRGGLFNAKVFDDQYNNWMAPNGTEWAYLPENTTYEESRCSMYFCSWRDCCAQGNTYSLPGKTCIVHLLEEDVYYTIKFLSWTPDSGPRYYGRRRDLQKKQQHKKTRRQEQQKTRRQQQNQQQGTPINRRSSRKEQPQQQLNRKMKQQNHHRLQQQPYLPPPTEERENCLCSEFGDCECNDHYSDHYEYEDYSNNYDEEYDQGEYAEYEDDYEKPPCACDEYGNCDCGHDIPKEDCYFDGYSTVCCYYYPSGEQECHSSPARCYYDDWNNYICGEQEGGSLGGGFSYQREATPWKDTFPECPVCYNARGSPEMLVGPADDTFVEVGITGVTPTNATITILAVGQDHDPRCNLPANGNNNEVLPNAEIQGSTVMLRRTRPAGRLEPFRYTIHFKAENEVGSCIGQTQVCATPIEEQGCYYWGGYDASATRVCWNEYGY